MKKINSANLKTIGFKKSDLKGSEAQLYIKDDICYKKFKDNDIKYLKDKERKIEFLSEMKNFEDAVLPLELGFDYNKNIIDGYTMHYYKDAINMFELSLITNVNELRKYYMAVHSSSLALKRIHDRHEGIILGDASYDNIIVIFHPFGMIEKTLCIDFDSVQISSIDCEFKVTSKLLANFYSDLGIKKYEHNQNTDRLTRLLYFLRTFFALDLFELPLYEYDKKCELSNTLKNLRSTIIELKKLMDDKKLPYIPYMHEVLDLTDVYELSRKI